MHVRFLLLLGIVLFYDMDLCEGEPWRSGKAAAL